MTNVKDVFRHWKSCVITTDGPHLCSMFTCFYVHVLCVKLWYVKISSVLNKVHYLNFMPIYIQSTSWNINIYYKDVYSVSSGA